MIRKDLKLGNLVMKRTVNRKLLMCWSMLVGLL